MKAKSNKIKLLSVVFLFFLLVCFVSCDDKNVVDPRPNPDPAFFAVGNDTYPTLQAAVDSLSGRNSSRDGDYTIRLLKDVSDSGAVISGISAQLKIDFGNFTYTLTGGIGIQINDDVPEVEISNGKIKTDKGCTADNIISSGAKLIISSTSVSATSANAIEIKGNAEVELLGTSSVVTGKNQNAIKASGSASVKVLSSGVVLSGGLSFSGTSSLYADQGSVHITSISVEGGEDEYHPLKLGSGVDFTVSSGSIRNTVENLIDSSTENPIDTGSIQVFTDYVIVFKNILKSIINEKDLPEVFEVYSDFNFKFFSDVDVFEKSVTFTHNIPDTVYFNGNSITNIRVIPVEYAPFYIPVCVAFSVDGKDIVYECYSKFQTEHFHAKYSVDGGETITIPYDWESDGNDYSEFRFYSGCFEEIEKNSEIEFTELNYDDNTEKNEIHVSAKGSVSISAANYESTKVEFDSISVRVSTKKYTISLNAKNVNIKFAENIVFEEIAAEEVVVEIKHEKSSIKISLGGNVDFQDNDGFVDFFGNLSLSVELADAANSAILSLSGKKDNPYASDYAEYDGDLIKYLSDTLNIEVTINSCKVNGETVDLDDFVQGLYTAVTSLPLLSLIGL